MYYVVKVVAAAGDEESAGQFMSETTAMLIALLGHADIAAEARCETPNKLFLSREKSSELTQKFSAWPEYRIQVCHQQPAACFDDCELVAKTDTQAKSWNMPLDVACRGRDT